MDWLRKLASFPGGRDVTSTPSKAMAPLLGSSRVPSRCSRVDLPTPDAPTMDTKAPGASSRSIPRRTSMTRPPWLNTFHKSRTTRCAPPLLAVGLAGADDSDDPIAIRTVPTGSSAVNAGNGMFTRIASRRRAACAPPATRDRRWRENTGPRPTRPRWRFRLCASRRATA